LGYYLRLVREALLEPEPGGDGAARMPGFGGAVALGLCSAATLGAGWSPAARDWLFSFF